MERNNECYLQKRPYRKTSFGSTETKFLLNLMEKKFSSEVDNYWERFGYEIGGPVCYGYVKWIIDEIEQSHPDITDLAFVARDGWLLQKVFDLLPHRTDLRSHYLYAPRTMNLLCQDKGKHAEYKKYLSGKAFGNGTLAVVDTVTMKFSSQRLISSAVEQNTHGFFWVILDSPKDYGASLSFSTYQTAHYHTIRCWNLMEFIMTSPEPPIRSMERSKPVYRSTNAFEAQRGAIFEQIEAGVLEFVRDVCAKGEFLELNNVFVTEWVNNFLKYPAQEDIAAFENVMFSELEDHSDSIPLNPFGQQKFSFKTLKDRLWLFSQRHKYLYRVLHAGNAVWKRTKMWLKGKHCLKFNGNDLQKMAETLSQYDVVSFDVFDTLIFREVDKPTELFYGLEGKNGLFDFHDNRILAEAAARRNSGKPNGEVNLFDIYQELSKHYMLDTEKGVNEELAAEKAVCYANPVMKELYQMLVSKGCRIIAVSDMYIPGKRLRELLGNCGYADIECVFVSCDHGVGKGTGSLQKLVQSKLGGSLRFVHIGDNYSSDVQGSEMAGWSAVWYRKKR